LSGTSRASLSSSGPGCDAAELIAQAGDDVAVEEAPRRVAVEEHDDGT
jgi:hypothetical protein